MFRVFSNIESVLCRYKLYINNDSGTFINVNVIFNIPIYVFNEYRKCLSPHNIFKTKI